MKNLDEILYLICNYIVQINLVFIQCEKLIIGGYYFCVIVYLLIIKSQKFYLFFNMIIFIQFGGNILLDIRFRKSIRIFIRKFLRSIRNANFFMFIYWEKCSFFICLSMFSSTYIYLIYSNNNYRNISNISYIFFLIV